MTLKKLLKLYKHYKYDYDFKLSKQSYKDAEYKANHEGEFLPDQKGGIIWQVHLVEQSS